MKTWRFLSRRIVHVGFTIAITLLHRLYKAVDSAHSSLVWLSLSSLIEQKILNGYFMLTIETELKHLYPPRVTNIKDAIIRLPFQSNQVAALFAN